MICTIVMQSRVKSIIRGLNSYHLSKLVEQYRVFTEHARFTTAYLLGKWDGNVYFVKDTGETYTVLLENIIPILTKWGYTIEIEDYRAACEFEYDLIDSSFFAEYGITLRDYQVESANQLLDNDCGIIIAGTGAGKTLICAAVCKQYANSQLRSCVIVPDQLLTEQTYDTFKGVGIDVGKYTGKTKDVDHDCVISTWQALKNNKELLLDIDIVIIDECHTLTGQVLNQMIYSFGDNFKGVYGVTGTLPKSQLDQMYVQTIVGPVRYTITTHKLIKENWLAVPNIKIIPIEFDVARQYDDYFENTAGARVTYQEFKDGFFPDYTSEKKYISTNADRLKTVANIISHASTNGNVLCLVSSIQVGKKLMKLVPDSVFMQGSTDVEVRKSIGDLFEQVDNFVAFAMVRIAGTGWSVTRIHSLAFVDIGKSFTRVIQSIGRGLRKGGDKTHVDIYDICSDSHYSTQHMKKRIKYYKDEKIEYHIKPIKIGESIDNI